MSMWNVCTVWPTHCVVCSGDAWKPEPCNTETCRVFRARVEELMSGSLDDLAMSIVYIAHRQTNINARVPRVPAAALVWAARAGDSTETAGTSEHKDTRRCACVVAAFEQDVGKSLSCPRSSVDYRHTLTYLRRAVNMAYFPGGLQSIEQYASETPGLTQRIARPTVDSTETALGKTSARADPYDARDASGYARMNTDDKPTYTVQRMHECLHAAVHLGAPSSLRDAAAHGVMDAEERVVLGRPYTAAQREARMAVLLQHHEGHVARRVLRRFGA